jgi:NarL family two-component system response regulator LiaR
MGHITVLVADDHPLVRDGIVNLLQKESDFEVVGQAADGEEAVRLVGEKYPDVVVMDIEMPKMDGLDATRCIKAVHPETSVLVLTVHDDEEYIAALLDAGAAGYLLKTTFGKELVQAIRSVHFGKYVLDTQVGHKVFRTFSQRSIKPVPLNMYESLSSREVEVLRLAAQGMSNKEIADIIYISPRTVKGYFSDIFSKLNVSSRTEAITTCLRVGIFSLDDLSQQPFQEKHIL